MRHPRRWLPLFALITTLLACAEALTGPDTGPGPDARDPAATHEHLPEAPLSFQVLAPGDVVAVDIEAQGCFHRDTYELQLEVGPGGALVLSGSGTSHFVPPGDTPETQHFEARRLTAAEVAGLDRMLAYYRAGPGDGCTSTHTTRLRLLRGGVAYREEAYADGSCRMSEAEGVVSFFSLLWDQVLKSQRAAG